MSKNNISAYHLSVRYLAIRARTEHEIRQYLIRKKFCDEDIENTIRRLRNENLVNDKEFTSFFVENRERFKPKSRFALTFELKRKGVEDDIIENCTRNIDEYTSALSAVKPKLKLWESCENRILRKKIINYLKNRGFCYDVCIFVLDSVTTGNTDY